MPRGKRSVVLASGMALVSLAAWWLVPSQAQQGAPTTNRFEFAILESFDPSTWATRLGTPVMANSGRGGPRSLWGTRFTAGTGGSARSPA